MRPRQPPFCLALTPGGVATGDEAGARRLRVAVAAAVGAGLGGVLLREPRLGDGPFLALARVLRDVLGPDGWLGLHDRPHLVAAAGADAVHLGFRSLAPKAARERVGPSCAVGLSVHAGELGRLSEEVDYALFGPVRRTPSKEGLLEPTGFRGLKRAVEAARCPVLAIGGLEPGDGAAVRAAGAQGMAVLRGILGSQDPAGATRAYLKSWEPEI